MAILAAYLFVAGLVVIGKGLLSLAKGTSQASSGFPEALAVGSVVLGYELFLLNLCGVVLTRPKCLVVLGLDFGMALTAVGFRPWKGIPSEAMSWITRKRSLLSLASMGLLLAAFVTAWMEASALPLYHLDALAHFGFEAKILFHEGTFRTPFFFDRTIVHEGTKYPLLVPYIEAAYYEFIGRLDDGAVRHLFLAWWLAWLVLIYRSLRQRLEEDLALPLLAIVGTLPAFFADHPAQAVSGCGDIPFALLWTAAVFGVLRWLDSDDREALWVAGFAGLGAIFCKPNGTILVGGLWILAAMFRPSEKRTPAMATLVAVYLCLAPWFWERAHMPREIIEAPINWRWSSLFHDLHRIPLLAVGSARELLRPELWGGFWLFVLVSTAFGRQRDGSRQHNLLFWILAMQLAAYFAFYVISPETVNTVVVWTLTRWLTHVIGPLMVWCGWQWAGRYSGR